MPIYLFQPNIPPCMLLFSLTLSYFEEKKPRNPPYIHGTYIMTCRRLPAGKGQRRSSPRWRWLVPRQANDNVFGIRAQFGAKHLFNVVKNHWNQPAKICLTHQGSHDLKQTNTSHKSFLHITKNTRDQSGPGGPEDAGRGRRESAGESESMYVVLNLEIRLITLRIELCKGWRHVTNAWN